MLGNEEKHQVRSISEKTRAAKLPSLQKTIKQTHFFPQPVSQNTNVLLKAYNSGRAHTLALWGGILIKAV